MQRLKSLLSLALAILLVSAFSFTSCGGKKDTNNETEHVEGGEHPADGAEHHTDGKSTEHPADSTAQ